MREIYWFKVKKSGFGWTPYTFEGYMVTYLYVTLQVGLTIIFFQRLGSPLIPQLTSVIMFIFLTLVLMGLLLTVCVARGEKLTLPWEKK